LEIAARGNRERNRADADLRWGCSAFASKSIVDDLLFPLKRAH